MVAEQEIIRVSRARRLSGEIDVPGDKSISHRAVILGSLAAGISTLRHFAPGADCASTIRCLKSLGIKIVRQESCILIHGKSMDGLIEPCGILNAGNSGTTIRLLSGILAAQPFFSIISGDASLRNRPMKRIIEPLRLMGADISGRRNNSLAPLAITGKPLSAIKYTLPVPSAQVKSAILLAGLYAQGNTSIIEHGNSRDHTERMLQQMGACVSSTNSEIIVNQQDNPLNPLSITVPGDISSAAYWLVAGAVHPDAAIKILRCGINPTRTGILDVLERMGAKISLSAVRQEGDEPVADIHVETSRLHGIDIERSIMPRLIDEIPIVAVAACFASGNTVIRDAAELRVKESDRILTTIQELSRMGAKIEELPDGMVIKGGTPLKGAEVYSHNDHRLAMSLAIAGLMAKGETVISNSRAIDISYPPFSKDLALLSAGTSSRSIE